MKLPRRRREKVTVRGTTPHSSSLSLQPLESRQHRLQSRSHGVRFDRQVRLYAVGGAPALIEQQLKLLAVHVFRMLLSDASWTRTGLHQSGSLNGGLECFAKCVVVEPELSQRGVELEHQGKAGHVHIDKPLSTSPFPEHSIFQAICLPSSQLFLASQIPSCRLRSRRSGSRCCCFGRKAPITRRMIPRHGQRHTNDEHQARFLHHSQRKKASCLDNRLRVVWIAPAEGLSGSCCFHEPQQVEKKSKLIRANHSSARVWQTRVAKAHAADRHEGTQRARHEEAPEEAGRLMSSCCSLPALRAIKGRQRRIFDHDLLHCPAGNSCRPWRWRRFTQSQTVSSDDDCKQLSCRRDNTADGI